MVTELASGSNFRMVCTNLKNSLGLNRLGCVCCSVRSTLAATIENLVDKRKDLDYIFLESTGLAGYFQEGV